jgi:hypothetical protein
MRCSWRACFLLGSMTWNCPCACGCIEGGEGGIAQVWPATLMAKAPPLPAAVMTAVSAGASAAGTATTNPYCAVCPGPGVSWPGGGIEPEGGAEEVMAVRFTGETAAVVIVTGLPSCA